MAGVSAAIEIGREGFHATTASTVNQNRADWNHHYPLFFVRPGLGPHADTRGLLRRQIRYPVEGRVFRLGSHGLLRKAGPGGQDDASRRPGSRQANGPVDPLGHGVQRGLLDQQSGTQDDDEHIHAGPGRTGARGEERSQRRTHIRGDGQGVPGKGVWHGSVHVAQDQRGRARSEDQLRQTVRAVGLGCRQRHVCGRRRARVARAGAGLLRRGGGGCGAGAGAHVFRGSYGQPPTRRHCRGVGKRGGRSDLRGSPGGKRQPGAGPGCIGAGGIPATDLRIH